MSIHLERNRFLAMITIWCIIQFVLINHFVKGMAKKLLLKAQLCLCDTATSGRPDA